MAFSKTEALEFLRRVNTRKRLAHAYLITGPSGSGKRILAEELSTLVTAPLASQRSGGILQHPDVHVAEPESKSRRIVIDQVRELEKELQMRSSIGGKKVGIIFDADRLQIQASNAFLKTLEEPPNNSLLLLTSEHPEMLPDTILSRCITVLLSGTGRGNSPLQMELLEILRQFFRHENAGLAQVFGLTRRFTGLLQQAREQIQRENEAGFKREEALYKQTTSSDWLDDREDYYKALTESRYLQQRLALVDTLMQWWADVLRHQQGYNRPDQPDYADDTARIATLCSSRDILKRITHLEELRENFNRNVQEALAIDVAFLNAFSMEGATQPA